MRGGCCAGLLASPLRRVFINAVVNGKAELPLQFPAYLVPYPKIPEFFVAGIFFGMDHIIRNVHMQVGRVFVNTAMALVVGIAESEREPLINGLESLRREPGLVFGPEADNQVIGL
ncbi:MAG: hypothetical protein DESF_01837 [Desulfovibrio sp.]